ALFLRGILAFSFRLLFTMAVREILHDVQVVESVLTVEETSFIDLAAVFLDVSPRQCRTAQDDRNVDSSLIQYFKILFHNYGRLDQQTTHADAIRLLFDRCLNNVLNRLFYAEIDDAIAVI